MNRKVSKGYRLKDFDDGKTLIVYTNPNWNRGIVEKAVMVDSPEHRNQFIGLLKEAGYKKKRLGKLT